MENIPLTGAQKTRLRGLGQVTEVAIKIGKAGLAPTFFREFARLLDARELVKIRFEGADRGERATLIARIEGETGVSCAGAVGHTALFFRPHPDPAKQTIKL
ncbi:MAG: YhbY family RNA-binding protein [Verrucomicrobia bacterium]|nr:MAG: YhbY family RNA-binding protein [Verrucomicrobiota bacterium]